METVSYAHRFDYTYDSESGELFPVLPLRIENLHNPQQALDFDTYLDSGTQRSLFDGRIAAEIGIDLSSGEDARYGSSSGFYIGAKLHTVRLSHPNLGIFDLKVGFSTIQIKRNLLGRDFFNFIQIGFRERHLLFYVTNVP